MDARVVVITGARRGIGLETARLLRFSGFRVVGVDLDQPEDPDAFDLYAVGDLREPQFLRDVLDNEVPKIGPLHALVNNAVVSPPTSPPVPFVEASLDDLDSAYAVNVRALFSGTQDAARILIRSEAGGSIVNLGSIHGERGAPGMAIYSATKGAVAALTRCLAVELAPHRIRCNAVAPAPTATRVLVESLADRDIAKRSQRIPWGRLAETSEVAESINFLVSDASGFITGVTLPVDGGYLAFGMA